MRAFFWWALSVGFTLLPQTVEGQWPGEVVGRVTDALTGKGVPGATVRVAESEAATISDLSGRFRLRLPDSGGHLITVVREGYREWSRRVRIEHGLVQRIDVSLDPLVFLVAGVVARAVSQGAGAYRVLAGESTGRATAADLLRRVPGVTITERGRGGAQTVSIRGSAADQVLVLVDGIALNDPISGGADLSLIGARTIRSITVLPGARSARYGDRAMAGVVLIETTSQGLATEVSVGVGALGEKSARVESGRRLGRSSVHLGGMWKQSDGRFAFEQPPEIGGGGAVRTNADYRRWALQGQWNASVWGGTTAARIAWDGIERGLPGQSFAQSVGARQSEHRVSGGIIWRHAGAREATVEAFAAGARARYRDPEPPLGLAYDETSRVSSAGAQVRMGLSPPRASWQAHTLVELEHQRVVSGSLAVDAPIRRTDVAVGVRGVSPPFPVAPGLTLDGGLRLQRVGLGGDLLLSHEITLASQLGPWRLHLAHRSAFRQPALADQFFRAGVGVQPNPNLRGERVPGEIELGIASEWGTDPLRATIAITVYDGGVRDMIEWAPDFRFIWSPRNVDVARSGIEGRAEIEGALVQGTLRLTGSFSRVSVTYRDKPDPVQLRYRPKHFAMVATTYARGLQAATLTAVYLGSRLPVPAEVNRLPGFWSLNLAFSTTVDLGRWTLEPALRIERVLDARGTMIFGFPDPGRVASFELTLRRSQKWWASPGPLSRSNPLPSP